jgi:glycosyltransferase involved in cell wall biosynthesis
VNPLVSVVIPAYNRAGEIGRAIDSAFNQTYRPIEVIVVDDGSQDNTAAVVAKYPEVRYYRQENRGASVARNQGVELARGEYIAFLDSDDLWVKNKLELQMELALRLHAPVLGARKKYVTESAGINQQELVKENSYHFITFKRQLRRTWLVPSTVVVRKDYFQRFSGFDPLLKIAEDWDLWLKMAHNAPIPRMDAVLTYNFVTKGSLSENRLEKYLYDLEVIRKWNPQNSPLISAKLYRKWCIAFTVSRLFKLWRRTDKASLLAFWQKTVSQLPLPQYIVWMGVALIR